MRNTLYALLLVTIMTNQSNAKTLNLSTDITPATITLSTSYGEIVKKTYNYGFKHFEISSGLNAELYKSDKEFIEIFAPSNLMKYVIVDQSGDKVHVKIKGKGLLNVSTDRIKVRVYTKNFNKLVANSGGNIILKDHFSLSNIEISASSSGNVMGNITANNVKISASSSGDFKGEIKANNVNLEASSSGDILLRGHANHVSAKASSSGDIKAENFVAKNANLSTNSSSDIIMGVSHKLKANASSSGDIKIIKKGDLSDIDTKENSSGSIVIR